MDKWFFFDHKNKGFESQKKLQKFLLLPKKKFLRTPPKVLFLRLECFLGVNLLLNAPKWTFFYPHISKMDQNSEKMTRTEISA